MPRTIQAFAAHAAFLVAIGCASQDLAYETAVVASRQLASTSDAIDAKIRAENEYYDNLLALTRMASANARSNDLIDRIAATARSGRESYDTAKARDPNHTVTTAWVATFMRTSVQEWAAAASERREAFDGSLAELAENRRKLESARAEVKKLANQLSVLAKARDDSELLRFYVGFAESVKRDYDELSEKAEAAAEEQADAAVPSQPTPTTTDN